jgi:RNA polymerase sigma-70 factor (ECF subfamily)
MVAMFDAPSAETSTTLLGKLRRGSLDQDAWSEFVDRYAPCIFGWCRRWHLQEADAQDVTQNVLLKLSEQMRRFAYDPSKSFRGWLKTLTHHAWYDFVKSQQRQGVSSGDSAARAALETLEAREELTSHLEEAFDRELLEEAMARVRLRVEPRTWEAFRLLAEEGWSGARAAGALQMKVATVYVARSKVQKMLQEEVHKLDSPAPVENP